MKEGSIFLIIYSAIQIALGTVLRIKVIKTQFLSLMIKSIKGQHQNQKQLEPNICIIDSSMMSCLNISLPLSKCDGCTGFYMASMNSRSIREMDSYTLCSLRHTFYACNSHRQGPKTIEICKLWQHKVWIKKNVS